MKFTTSLTSNDPLAKAAKAVLEAKFGPQPPAKNEETLAEASGFNSNRAVVNAKTNLERVKTSFWSTSILARLVIQEVGPGAKKDFEKIEKLLSQVEDIWEEIEMEAQQAYAASLRR